MHTRMNCTGTSAELRKCEKCDYEFCGYHFVPVVGLWVLEGGHVCKGVTVGTGFFGDSAADYFDFVVALAKGPSAIGAKMLAAATSAAIDMVIGNMKTAKDKAETEVKEIIDSLETFKDKIASAGSGNPAAVISVVMEAKALIAKLQ